MKYTKTLVLILLVSVTGLMTTITPNSAVAFPFSDGNNNSGSSTCYHNGQFDGMVYGGASCPEPPANSPKHCPPNQPCVTPKHTLEDCIITEVPHND